MSFLKNKEIQIIENHKLPFDDIEEFQLLFNTKQMELVIKKYNSNDHKKKDNCR